MIYFQLRPWFTSKDKIKIFKWLRKKCYDVTGLFCLLGIIKILEDIPKDGCFREYQHYKQRDLTSTAQLVARNAALTEDEQGLATFGLHGGE